MYERFTDRARKVMSLARAEARRHGCAVVTGQHLLSGLVHEGKGVAMFAVQRLHPDLEAIKTALAAGIAADAPERPTVEIQAVPPRTAWGRAVNALREWAAASKLPLDAETQRVIENAMREARALRHPYVGDEHLLLGLLDESENAATKLLSAHGLKSDDIRREVLRGYPRTSGATRK